MAFKPKTGVKHLDKHNFGHIWSLSYFFRSFLRRRTLSHRIFFPIILAITPIISVGREREGHMAHISRLSPIFRSVSLRGRTMLAAYFAGICEVFGLNCSTRSRNLVWLHQLRVPLSTITNLFFF